MLEFSQPISSNESGIGEDGSLFVEVDCEVTTFEEKGELSSSSKLALANNDSSSISEMARSKQTLRKSGQDYNKYWRARFGKPGGKASQHLRVRQEDDDGESSSSSSDSDTKKMLLLLVEVHLAMLWCRMRYELDGIVDG